jgi:hypothetical protein
VTRDSYPSKHRINRSAFLAFRVSTVSRSSATVLGEVVQTTAGQ